MGMSVHVQTLLPVHEGYRTDVQANMYVKRVHAHVKGLQVPWVLMWSMKEVPLPMFFPCVSYYFPGSQVPWHANGFLPKHCKSTTHSLTFHPFLGPSFPAFFPAPKQEHSPIRHRGINHITKYNM
jgi:hypothetical protein